MLVESNTSYQLATPFHLTLSGSSGCLPDRHLQSIQNARNHKQLFNFVKKAFPIVRQN